MTVSERLFDATQAFGHPVTMAAVAAIVVGLLAASMLVRVLHRSHQITPDTYRELRARIRSWYVLAATMVVPILYGTQELAARLGVGGVADGADCGFVEAGGFPGGFGGGEQGFDRFVLAI